MGERDQDGFEPDPEGFTPDPPASSTSMFDDIFTVPNAIRFGGSALGSVAAGAAASTGVGLLGSGALMAGGGALGEAGARWWEGKPFDPGITATEGLLNLLPGGGEIPGKGAALSKIGKYALQQAGHGAWQGAVGAFPRKQAESGNLLNPSQWEAPSWDEIGNQTVAGGGIGLVTGGTLGAANAKFGKAARPSIAPPVDVPPPFEHPPVKPNDYIYQPDKSSARPIREGESIGDYITGRDEDPFTSSVLNEPTRSTASQIEVQGGATLTGERLRDLTGLSPREAIDQGIVIQEPNGQYRVISTGETPAQAAAPIEPEKPTFQPLTNVPEGAEFLRNFAGDPNAIPEAKAKASELLRRVTSGEIAPDEAERLFFADVDARTSRAGFREVAPQPQAAFDPNSLTGLRRTEVEFVDPTTGEVRSSADARPGDVPVPNAPKAAAPQAPSTPSTLTSWIDELIKNESGTFDPAEMGRNLRRTFLGSEGEPATKSPAADAFAEDVPATAARAARRVDPDIVMPDVRSTIDGMADQYVQNLVNTFEGNPTAYGESGRNAALYGRDVLEARAAERAANPPAQAAERPEFVDRQPDVLPRSYSQVGMVDSATPDLSNPPIAQVPASAEPVQIPRSRFDVEPTTSHTGGEDEIRPPVSSRITDTVEQVRGMTTEEVRRSFAESSGNYTRADIAPLLRELERNPTEGTRALAQEIRSRFGDGRSTITPSGGELPVKPPVEVTPEQRAKSHERLARIGGAEAANKLISGEAVINAELKPYRPARRRGRPNTSEKISPETADHWNKWGDRQIADHVDPHSAKPGMTVLPPDNRHFPNWLKIEFRDSDGSPIGYLESNLDGSGIQTLAVSSKLGLRRGKVAFTLLKAAMDRGITEPSGVTSDWTKNLIDRVKSLVRGEEGHLDLDTVAQNLVDIMNGTVRAAKAVSKFGKKAAGEVSRFFQEDKGELDLGRLQELFQKKQSGTLTPEELAEAKALAQEAKSQPAAPTTEAPTTPKPAGQVTWSNTRKSKAPTTTPAPALPKAASLPAELAGAKPRFNIGADSYSPSFADDLDKALFIIAQKTRSKSDHKYLQFVMEQTGMDEASARLAGQGVRTTIKNQLSGAEPGVVRIESIWRKNQQPQAETAQVAPKVTAKEAGNGTIAKAANESPAAKQQTPEQAVAASVEAEAATASLTKRLKRAVENPNPANSQYEIDELLDEAAAAMNKLPEGQRAGYIRKVLGANKALLTAWDLSAPGRQGKAFILNKSWWTSLDDMVKAWGSAKAADAVAQSIVDHPSGYFKRGVDKFGKPTPSFAERMGLDLAGVEELFTTNKGSAFEKYSGVGKSSRAHTAFLNKLRSDQFVAMMESATKLGLDPQANLHQAQTYAKFINDATGRGSLNVGKWKLERNLGAINDVMFAPKNLSGQIRTWNAVLNPMKYASYDPVMRNQALRSLLAIAGSGLAVGELSRLMGGKIVDDPTSSDFRKIRVGDTRIDLFGGYQQFPVAAMKFLMNQETPTSGRDAGRTISFDKGGAFRNRATVAERFFTNRLSPAGSFVWSWMNNREFDGKPFEVKRALYERTAPIVLKDLYELAKDDPALAAIMTPTNTLGLTGTQTYGRN